MIRHMVLFRFATHVSNEQQSLVLAGLADLPRLFPTMKRFGVGINISQRDQTYSHVMTIEFDARAELEAYLNSKEHEHFVATTFKPNIERRAIASYELD
jgi:hypothetical protein